MNAMTAKMIGKVLLAAVLCTAAVACSMKTKDAPPEAMNTETDRMMPMTDTPPAARDA